ncbi:hypothetical protein Ddc_08084 [Ditylenchus destructor]|nr:hypothetical protein Ddc_08084 [Ditylenchus destructor]
MLDESRPLCHIRANSELVCGTLKRQSNGKSAERGKHSRVGKGCVCRLFPTASPLDVAMCGRDEQRTSATQFWKGGSWPRVLVPHTSPLSIQAMHKGRRAAVFLGFIPSITRY